MNAEISKISKPRRHFGRAVAGVFVGLAGLTLALGSTTALAQSYPSRPITLIVPWGAGGGTDAVGRMMAIMLERDLGKPVNVVNRTGGSGVVGHSAIATATPDGYTIGMATVEIGMMHWQGLTDLNSTSYTPLALVNADPAGVQVRADSPYKTVNELLAAIRANPGKLKASGTGQGGIWHLAIAGLLRDQKIDPATLPWVPSNGAAPGLQDMIAGGIDVAPVSLPESRALIDAGKVRSLAIMDERPSALYPNVPTLKSAVGSDWTMAAWRGLVAPKGIPNEARDKLAASLRKIVASKDYTEFMAKQGYGVIFAGPDDFAKFMAKSNTELGATMKAVGLIK